MDITKAYEILHKYYTEKQLIELYQSQNFDGSESDMIRTQRYNAELLRKKAKNVSDEQEKSEIYEAVNIFEEVGEEEFWLK